MPKTETPTIVVYTHPDCAYSTAVKIDYNNRGIDFKEIDISVHPEAIPELERLAGGERITPVVVEGDKVTIGFNGIG
ncbi:MAG: UXX-star (seleno)protein family 2 [Dehalococcoidia bacterium]|nr:UXX-star (seleno)protein family 2 [Chloroflexota bacterium]MCZ6866723.1 UXX-star (seleno)protein family 2 [Chloroflexota bacterium]